MGECDFSTRETSLKYTVNLTVCFAIQPGTPYSPDERHRSSRIDVSFCVNASMVRHDENYRSTAERR